MMVDARPFHHFQEPCSYEAFELYMKHNTPCTFASWISADWPAVKNWVQDDKTPALSHINSQFGQCQASVSWFVDEKDQFDCYNQTIAKFINYWEDLNSSRDSSVHEDFPEHNFESLPHYLKDWHFARDTNPDDVYQVPEVFSDDWLNRYWKTRDDVNDDYIFSYFGPAGSFTPFHADVFRSFSWSVNVCGRKKWLILFPGEELKLDKQTLNVERQCIRNGLKYKILYQEAGEGIFVPSGWWHQVLNTLDTISINHNWCNYHCIPKMWNYLASELELVEHEIRDCRHLMNYEEWHEHCQLILRANIGLNYSEFLEFVLTNLVAFSPTEFDNLVQIYGLVSFKKKFKVTSESNLIKINPLYEIRDIVDFAQELLKTISGQNVVLKSA